MKAYGLLPNIIKDIRGKSNLLFENLTPWLNRLDAGNEFVASIDPEKRYLTCRRYITKAKFDVYFSIRTSVAQFNQRQDILKGVDWEKYLAVQECFKELGNI